MFYANFSLISTVSNKEEERFPKTEDTITEIHEPKIECSEENKTHMLHQDILQVNNQFGLEANEFTFDHLQSNKGQKYKSTVCKNMELTQSRKTFYIQYPLIKKKQCQERIRILCQGLKTKRWFKKVSIPFQTGIVVLIHFRTSQDKKLKQFRKNKQNKLLFIFKIVRFNVDPDRDILKSPFINKIVQQFLEAFPPKTPYPKFSQKLDQLQSFPEQSEALYFALYLKKYDIQFQFRRIT